MTGLGRLETAVCKHEIVIRRHRSELTSLTGKADV